MLFIKEVASDNSVIVKDTETYEEYHYTEEELSNIKSPVLGYKRGSRPLAVSNVKLLQYHVARWRMSGKEGYLHFDFIEDKGEVHVKGPEVNTPVLDGVLTIPYGVTHIDNQAFMYLSNLQEIRFPPTIQYIGVFAFMGTDIRDVCIPDTVKELGRDCFCNCASLRKIVFPRHLSTIPDECCYSCKSLEEVVLPDSLFFIGTKAFADCFNLKNLKLPSVRFINSRAFYGCTSLRGVRFPSNLCSLEDEAFGGVKQGRVELPIRIAHIGNAVFAGTTHSCVVFFDNEDDRGISIRDCKRVHFLHKFTNLYNKDPIHGSFFGVGTTAYYLPERLASIRWVMGAKDEHGRWVKDVMDK